MGNPSLLYRSVKSIENEGVSTFLHKGRRYISERLVEFYYLNMHASSSDNVLEPNYYYFGHPKCATNWIRSFLYHLCLRKGINYEVHGGDRSKVFSSRRFESTFNLYVNSLPEHIEQLDKNSKGFRMIRDPRDLLISAYFSWKNSHYHNAKRQVEIRELLQRCSMEEGLIFLMKDFDSFKAMKGWHLTERPGIRMVKYEDLLADSHREFRALLDHLDISVSEEIFESCLAKSSFTAMTGKRSKGVENKHSHYRKGVSGDWINYMPRESEPYARFLELHGPLMTELGYE